MHPNPPGGPVPPAAGQPYPHAPGHGQPGPGMPGPGVPGPGMLGPGVPGMGGPNSGWAGQPQPGHPGPAPVRGPLALAVPARLAGLLAVLLGLSLPFDSSCMWVTATAWSILAALAAIVALLAGFGASLGWSPATARSMGVIATGALVIFWVLIALPGVSSNSGFCLTLGVGAMTAAGWLSWGRTYR